jgi:hypothetical protein
MTQVNNILYVKNGSHAEIPNPKALEPDRPQHGRSADPVIAQQYSPITFL